MNSGGVVYKVCYGSKAGILDRIGFNSGYAFFPLHFNIPSLLLFFMSICELCGKQDSLVSAAVEGVDLKVCSSCAKFGTVRRQGSVVPSHAHSHSISRSSMPELMVVPQFSSQLRSARESKELNQEEFAKLLNERVSVVSKWEQGVLKPSVEAAQRVGRILGLHLVVKDDASTTVSDTSLKTKSSEFTLGDFVKVRKRG